MSHLPQLVIDLSIILVAAGIISIVFKKLKQPLLLGYIVAGFLVGPHFDIFPTITETENIKVWSEIGVIFLLFSLGLEFSFKKLLKVGSGASITAITKVALTMIVGYLVGQMLGWGQMDSIFLGGLLSISSTTITIKSYEDLGLKGQKFTGLVFGILVIEDLVAILLLVLLSTIAISHDMAGTQMLFAILKLIFFLVLCFLIGIFLLPTFLRLTRKWMNDETLLIFSLGLCLLMVYIATEIGFSPELGAFVMGSILAETTFAERIEHLIKHVKNLFGAIFFVSVGMLINPSMIVQHIIPVLVISFVTIFGKFIISTFSATLSGQPLKTSVQVGSSLSQIGEFSFIIAALGLSLKVTGEFLYPIAVAVSAISTLATPYMIKSSERIYIGISRILPKPFAKALDRYSTGMQTIKRVSDWRKLRKSYLIHILIFSVLIITILFLSHRYLVPFMVDFIGMSLPGRIIAESFPIILISPFLWALAFRNVKSSIAKKIWEEKRYRGLLILYRLLRFALALFYISLSISRSISYTFAIGIFLLVLIVLGLFSKRIQRIYNMLEQRFLVNYYEKEEEAKNNSKDYEQLTPWDAHLADFVIPAEWMYNGKTLLELGLREKYGVNIALIQRGSILISAPKRNEMLFPFDHIYIIGTDKQVEKFAGLLNVAPENSTENKTEEITLTQIVIDPESPILSKSIRDSGIRERSDGLIVGIERKGRRILNPDSTTFFEEGDIVWIVGNKKRIDKLFFKEKTGV
jgi:monovalent cation:H+ antiporter-2, CPA2 family